LRGKLAEAILITSDEHSVLRHTVADVEYRVEGKQPNMLPDDTEGKRVVRLRGHIAAGGVTNGVTDCLKAMVIQQRSRAILDRKLVPGFASSRLVRDSASD